MSTLAYQYVADSPLPGQARLSRLAAQDGAARPPATTYDVFISHSHADKAIAHATCAMLEGAGINRRPASAIPPRRTQPSGRNR